MNSDYCKLLRKRGFRFYGQHWYIITPCFLEKKMNRKTSKLFLSFFTELMGGKKKSSVGLRELGSVLQMFSFCSIGVLGWHVHFPACPPHLMTAQDLESCVPFGDRDIQPSGVAPTPTYSRAPSFSLPKPCVPSRALFTYCPALYQPLPIAVLGHPHYWAS